MTDDQILALFNETYANPDDAGLFLDPEGGSDAYNWDSYTRLETEDAVQEIAPGASEDQLARLAAELNSSYSAWVRRSEL
ncbi:hypothetical protein C5D04_10480 [Rathayibacter sp. AY1D2]|jgi:hypothetical protein|uniref:hypothetical protein n=1 Tax=unclassified Rathayibacter TaxID=2609250 RepID=UPI000CE7C118|nr:MULTISPECIES: hypothetical protein [unclassified Rathayibacter]PPF32469.1 hypothetical protein C5B93_15560 [Rathayibacter sp. AY1A2]PPI13228.1 hypothetical protein C5D04_10480 [Rathayibacter sp. AY1D2]